MARSYYYRYFPVSQPKAAAGGIKAQSKANKFAENWWAKRWIAFLEQRFDISARLGRGRSYARKGQVLAIDISKGLIKAKVQGSRSKPYDVTIKARLLSDDQWRTLTERLSDQVIFGAKLLAGEMPQDIEQVFLDAGLSLFPEKRNDLETDCSCPDWSNPCKHIAAVYYLMGEEFDRNPFLIFKLRGMDRQELMDSLGNKTGRKDGKTKPQRGKAAVTLGENPIVSSEPITADAGTYWNGSGVPDDLFGEVASASVGAALLRRLGKFPFWRGNQPLLATLEPIYTSGSHRGLDVFLGETIFKSGAGDGVVPTMPHSSRRVRPKE